MARMHLQRLGTSPRKQIVVSKDTIDIAIRTDSSHCMIADSIIAQIPEASFVSVDLQSIRWTDRAKGERYIYLTPAVAQVALVDFDQGDPVQPFSFRLQRGQVTRVFVSPNKQRQRIERIKELEALERAGRLTDGQKRGLTRMRLSGTIFSTSPGPAVVRADSHGVTISGGNTPPMAALSNTKGRVRKFGLRLLKPPVTSA